MYWIIVVRARLSYNHFRVEISTGKKILLLQRRFLYWIHQSLQEWNEGHESIVIFRLTQLLHQGLSLRLGQLFSKICQKSEKFVPDHCVIPILVVQLEDFHEVMEGSLILGVLASLVHREDISLGQELLSFFVSTSNLGNSLQCRVEITGTDAISLEVVHVKCKFDGVDLLLLKTKLSHDVMLEY